MEDRRILKDDTDAMFFGVCAGISHYFEINLDLLRILWFISFFGYGFGFGLYILLAILLPNKESSKYRNW